MRYRQRSPVVCLWLAVCGVLVFVPPLGAQISGGANSIWPARDVSIPPSPQHPSIRIGIWDSGVDTSLFTGQLARDSFGRVLLRGYDSFKRRQDTPMAQLNESLLARRDELNGVLQAYDDLDSGVESPAAARLAQRLEALPEAERAALEEDASTWAGYGHGTGVADIALTGHGRATLVIARMEWWHGSPPVPCWTRELAHREAESIRDLLAFLVESGARVVNLSWGRHESSYRSNLAECAPEMPVSERRALARYTVDTIRAVLRSGMAAAPNVLFVGAAGNEGSSVEQSNPATRLALPNFILVGAVNRAGAITSFTNTGPEVTLYANGDRVPARLPGGAQSFPSGTSMATPLVTNAAAKMLAVNPRLSGAELRVLLEQSADTNATGQRLLHTARAVEAARRASP